MIRSNDDTNDEMYLPGGSAYRPPTYPPEITEKDKEAIDKIFTPEVLKKFGLVVKANDSEKK
jgi:hypothetical protein